MWLGLELVLYGLAIPVTFYDKQVALSVFCCGNRPLDQAILHRIGQLKSFRDGERELVQALRGSLKNYGR